MTPEPARESRGAADMPSKTDGGLSGATTRGQAAS
jgi:hypothetical protein